MILTEGESNYSEKNLSHLFHYHFVHHKSHTDFNTLRSIIIKVFNVVPATQPYLCCFHFFVTDCCLDTVISNYPRHSTFLYYWQRHQLLAGHTVGTNN